MFKDLKVFVIPCTQVIEDKLLNDQELTRSFIFSCGEVGITDPGLVSVLPSIHKILLVKMVHTHGNGLLENRRMLGNLHSGVLVEVPLMLRDSLKVMATQ